MSWNENDDFGYEDDNPWGGEEGVGKRAVVLGFGDDDDDDYLGCECDDCVPAPAPKPNDDDDAVAPNPDAMIPVGMDEQPDETTVYEYTDCGGEGDRLTFSRGFGFGESLFVQINGDSIVILRDDQVNDLMSALLEWQERND